MIHVIINPVAGKGVAVLATINSIFRPANIKWKVSITLEKGDARLQARQAVADGVDLVAVYGGDGTIVEAASGLLDSDVPLAILPGGTANVVAQELGIPMNLGTACELLVNKHTPMRTLDLGQVNDEYFLLRVGLGTEAQITEGANRDLKNRIGFLAYVWSAAQSLINVKQARYYLTVDGKETEVDGITCGIINSGNMGISNLQIAPDIYMDDGLLDVLVVQDVNLPTLAELLGGVLRVDEKELDASAGPRQMPSFEVFDSSIRRWTGKEITVRVRPPQIVQYDGELLEDPGASTIDETHVRCKILPGAVRICVPKGVESLPRPQGSR